MQTEGWATSFDEDMNLCFQVLPVHKIFLIAVITPGM